MKRLVLRLVPFLLLALVGCTDSQAVNAAFSQTRVSWYRFDPSRPDGLAPLSGFEQSVRVVWLPRDHAVFATDVLGLPERNGAVAVSNLGLLVLQDRSGTLAAVRPGAQFPLPQYRTDRLFLWKERLFVGLYQNQPPSLPPVTLAWWAPGQARLTLYPVPSQVQDPMRQASWIEPPSASSVGLQWKVPAGSGWRFETGALDLASGVETPGSFEMQAIPEPGEDFAGAQAKLSERLGATTGARAVRGPETVALFTDAGWVAVAHVGGRARLYRLPDLGLAGHYTGAVGLENGFVFTWETSFRAFAGASGLVHVPYGVLAP